VRTRPLVLVIDDSDDARDLYTVALTLEGLSVEGASNGEEGVRKAVELLPDIVVTDLAMPVMDGWETIRRLKTDERTRRIPIIACSGDDDTLRGTLDAPADILLPKPCPLQLLVAEIQRLLRRNAA
jgi:two-component system, cell cycle response regulator DivK